MAHFAYQAQFQSGSAISGVIEADDFDVAMQRLTELRLEAIQLSETKPPRAPRQVSDEDFIFFNEQLAALSSAGMCLDEGLRQLASDVDSPKLRRVIEAIASDVQRGVPLDQAIANHESQLPHLYARTVRAGIESGQLPATLLNLSQHLRLLGETRRIIIETIAYPAMTLAFAVAIVALLLTFVVPSFEEIFLDFDTRLPVSTVLLFDLARSFPMLAALFGAVVVGFVICWLAMRASPGGRRFRERVAMSIPLIGAVGRSSLISRFSRSLALTVSSGVPLPEALRLAAGASGSALLDRDAEALATSVEQGESPGTQSGNSSLIPPMFGFVMDVAVGRNNLPEALVQLAGAYDLRAAHSQAMLRVWLMPLALLFVGLAVGFCIFSLFMPLINLVNSVSGGY